MIITKRRENCLKEFKKTGLDGLLLASSANFQYLTETSSYMWQRYCFKENEKRQKILRLY